ncbi:hypothetical protein CAEBREN_16457 [Caenorhabditis brenneri]|uniref:C-type LECtin n=1 Tax=Caenorhabditis brenneri TaxID=135651 RepID=G0MCV0_CAEBE|nr:hypothetical protein CAEBREN_16457 [Caenorhabditis brenneri]
MLLLPLALIPLLSVLTSATTPVCTNGFTLVGSKCLRLYTYPSTHQVAETTCASYGATLATPKNAVDNRAIATFVGSNPSLVWIGVYCFGSSLSKCMWDDATGSVEPYNSFASGFPLVDIGKCVYYSTQGALAGKWLSGDCDNEPRAFVCELPHTYTDICDHNYNGYCYIPIAITGFVAAQTQCERNCGNLATINSPNENRYINAFVSYDYNDGRNLMIGAIQARRSFYTWADGSIWGYNNVDPSSGYYDSCMFMSISASNVVPNGYWYSANCTSPSYFSLCKIPAGIKCNGAPPPVTVTPIPSSPSYCNSSVLIAPGVITSSHYPDNYDNNLYCVYQLTTIGSYRVQLTFTDFYTENGNDVVSVYNGDTVTSSALLGQYSGTLSTFSVKSYGNKMTVTFKTDGSVVYRGFSARFTSV